MRGPGDAEKVCWDLHLSPARLQQDVHPQALAAKLSHHNGSLCGAFLRELWEEDTFWLLLHGSWRQVSLKPVLILVPGFLTLYLPILPSYLSKPSPAFLLSHSPDMLTHREHAPRLTCHQFPRCAPKGNPREVRGGRELRLLLFDSPLLSFPVLN